MNEKPRQQDLKWKLIVILFRFAETLNEISRRQSTFNEHSNKNDWAQMQFVGDKILDVIRERLKKAWEKAKVLLKKVGLQGIPQ